MAENFSHKAMNSLLESHQLTREAIERGFEKTWASIEAMSVQIGQLSQLIKQQSQNIGRLETSVERVNTSIDRVNTSIEQLTASVDNHLRLAEQQNETAKMQAANISDLTRLVATHSETVNRLLERLAA